MMTLEAKLAEREKQMIERALPAHMMVLMLDECQKIGIEGRGDLLHHLNVASVAPLSQLDMLSVARVAKQIDSVATSLLHDLSPDDPREGLYVCATFVSVLVDEGRITDKTNQCVLATALLLDEAKGETAPDDNDGAIWKTNLKAWEAKARQMLFRAVMLGYFDKPDCN